MLICYGFLDLATVAVWLHHLLLHHQCHCTVIGMEQIVHVHFHVHFLVFSLLGEHGPLSIVWIFFLFFSEQFSSSKSHVGTVCVHLNILKVLSLKSK